MTDAQKTQIDFAKYRTSDLITTISGIISLPGAIKSLFKFAVFGVAALVFLVIFFLKVTGNFTWFWMLIFQAYGTPAGLVLGVTLGIAEFVRRSLSNMTGLIDLLLGTTMQVAADAQGLSSGSALMPPTRDLVEDVYEHVILVTTKEVLQSAFGFFGLPVYWFYHVTLNRMVRIAIKLIPSGTSVPELTAQELSSKVDSVVDATAEEGRIIASLLWAQQKFASIGWWAKAIVMGPCYAVVAAVVGTILSPLLITWWLWH